MSARQRQSVEIVRRNACALTLVYRRVYADSMTRPTKRDNAYWIGRLLKNGHHDLLELINRGEVTVYGASIRAGLRKRRAAPSRADQISYHYSRASIAEKRRFIIDNWPSVARIVSHLAKLQQSALEEKNSSDEEQK